MKTKLEQKVRFDGGFECREADQFIVRCKGGGINLNIHGIGRYIKCTGCDYQSSCQESGSTAGEQAF